MRPVGFIRAFFIDQLLNEFTIMAEGKKSFVLYSDYEELFEELTDADAGQLIKHIFKYVNDKNPITENVIVKVSFIPIKLQLKRDLKDWEQTRIKRSESGKLGGRPKNLENQNKAKEANAFLEKQSKAKKAVTVNVNVTDNVKEINNSEIDFSPFDSTFNVHWQTWLGYKWSQFRFKYKELSSEQTAFNDLVKKSRGEKLQAIAMISNSIANGWKGLVEIKQHYPQFEQLDKQTIHRPIGTTKSMFE